ncbi:MAG: efflux RND transporter periplasmic adaptor subunit [Aquabacterium sp.]
MGNTPTAGPTPWLVVGLIACVSLPSAPVHAAGKPAGCLIEPEQVADVGSPVTGIVEDLPVQLGDAVDAGQPLVRLRADVERANASVALMRAQVDAEVKAAQASWDLARQKVHRNKQLLDQNFVSAQAVEQAEAEAEVAVQKLKLAQSQQKIYAREEAVAQAQLGLRTLRSPIRGVVIERYNNLGERVEDKPVVRVAAIDPLRVSLMVPVAQYGQLAVGQSLVIRPELPGIDPVRATVTYVDKVLDAASNSFRVRLSLPNPGNRLPGGLRCKADFTAQAATPATGTTRPASFVAPMPVHPQTNAPAQTPAQPSRTPARVAMATPDAPPIRQTPNGGLLLKTAWTLSEPSLQRIVALRVAEMRTVLATSMTPASPRPAATAIPAPAPRVQAPAAAPARRLSTTLTLASAT